MKPICILLYTFICVTNATHAMAGDTETLPDVRARVQRIDTELNALRTEVDTIRALVTALPASVDTAKSPMVTQPYENAYADAFSEAPPELQECLQKAGVSPGPEPMALSENQLQAIDMCKDAAKVLCDLNNEDCNRKVDKTLKRLAALLRIVGAILTLTGHPEIGIPMMALGSALSGAGSGDESGTTRPSPDYVEGEADSACGPLCKVPLGDLRVTRVKDQLTIGWASGPKIYDLSKLMLGNHERATGQSDAIVSFREADDSFVLTFCTESESGQLGGRQAWRFALSDDGQLKGTQVGNGDNYIALGGACR